VAARQVTPTKSTAGSTASARKVEAHWRAAYELLPRARKSRANQVKDADSLARAAFELPSAFQAGWKAKTDALLDELEADAAPKLYLAHEASRGALLLYREDADGTREGRRITQKKPELGLVLGTFAALKGEVVLALVPLNDGDDLHYLFVKPELCRRLQTQLGVNFSRVFAEQPAAPVEVSKRRSTS